MKDVFTKEAMHFQSRDDFDDYMKTMENNYYETANLPKTPYTALASKADQDEKPEDLRATLPIWPPRPNSFRDTA